MFGETSLMPIAPELTVLVAACVALFLGVTRASRLAASTAFIGLLVAIGLTEYLGKPAEAQAAEAVLPGLLLTPLIFYIRMITLIIGALIVLVNWHQPAADERGEYFGLILFSLLGVLLTAAANDLLLLFFAIELVSVPTYVLVGLSRPMHKAAEASVKYFFLGALAAAVLAYGLTFLYGATGTTTLYALEEVTVRSTLAAADSPYVLIGMLLVVAGLGFKIAAVPFHVYAPDVYEGAAAPITGMLGFVPKLAGFVALVKLLAALDWNLPTAVLWLLWALAAVTMTTGNVLALLQTNAKRMLAYSSIAHTGYMLIALLVGPVAGEGPMRDGVAALLFYIGVYGTMNLGAFALIAAFRVQDREPENLADLGGLWRRSPWAAVGLAVCVFSLMGFPPTAGFVGKLYIFSSAFSLGEGHVFRGPLIALAVIGVLNSAVAAAYYLRIVGAVYFGAEAEQPKPFGGAAVRIALAVCAIAMIGNFIYPTHLSDEARLASVATHPTVTPGSSITKADEQRTSSLRSPQLP